MKAEDHPISESSTESPRLRSVSDSPRERMTEDVIRMNKDLITEHFQANRDRLWRAIQVRMDPRLYGRVDAEDILQEAYLDAVKRLEHFAQEDNFTPFVWLRLIVGQTLINVHRRHLNTQIRDASRELSLSAPLQHDLTTTSQVLAYQIAASQTSPSEAIVRTEEVHELAQALDGLSNIDREILTLRHFEDLSNKEVAELLNLEQKTASIRYVRAIQRLKHSLDSTNFTW